MELLKKNSTQKILKTFVLIFLGTMALTISAKIKIPFYPVPMTMQTFVVLFLGMSFGYKIGLATVGLYLLEGLIGLPVFSNSPEKGVGLIYFTGPTMGYLIGFLVAVFFAGFLKIEKTNLENIFFIFFKLIFSVSFIYIFGLAWLWVNLNYYSDNSISFYKVFEKGAKPFLIIETYKILILCILSKQFSKLRKII